MPNPAEIAAKLTPEDRSIAMSLLGNSWTGSGEPSPGLRRMIELDFMRVRYLGNRFKAGPTDKGHAVRAHLEKNDDRS